MSRLGDVKMYGGDLFIDGPDEEFICAEFRSMVIHIGAAVQERALRQCYLVNCSVIYAPGSVGEKVMEGCVQWRSGDPIRLTVEKAGREPESPEQRLERVARALCEARGVEPDKLVAYDNGTMLYTTTNAWRLAVEELTAAKLLADHVALLNG